MKHAISEVMATVSKFLVEEVGHDPIRITSVVAVEGESQWKVVAEIGRPATDKKEITVDDRDGKIVAYKQA